MRIQGFDKLAENLFHMGRRQETKKVKEICLN